MRNLFSALAIIGILGCSNAGSGDDLESKVKNVKAIDSEIKIDGVNITGISKDREVEYLAKDNKGIWYYVDRPKDDKDFKSYETYFRILIGPGDNMKKTEIAKAERYSDGGTTNIECLCLDKTNPKNTRLIKLFFPFNPDEKPTVTYMKLPEGKDEFEAEETRPLILCEVKNGKIYSN
jgi:hypothetical protein